MAIRQPSPAELERNRVNAAAKLAASSDRIATGVLGMTTGQDWADFLTFAARFRHFSFNNVLLLHLHAPSATYVAGYNTWIELGAQVRRGETGISVAADLVHGADSTTASTIPLMRPRNATVFDASQVDALDTAVPVAQVLVPPALSGSGTLTQLRAHLTEQLRSRGYTVTTSELDQTTPAADHHTKTVTLPGCAGAGDLATVVALAQQLAQAVLHDDRPEGPPLLEAVDRAIRGRRPHDPGRSRRPAGDPARIGPAGQLGRADRRDRPGRLRSATSATTPSSPRGPSWTASSRHRQPPSPSSRHCNNTPSDPRPQPLTWRRSTGRPE